MLYPNKTPHGTNSGYQYWGCPCPSCLAAHKAYQREYHQRNQAAKNEKTRLWRRLNPGYESELYQRSASRRASRKINSRAYKFKKRSLNCNHTCVTPGAISKIEAAWGHRCYYCNRGAESMDHLVPLSKGGANCVENLVPSCKSCNSKKGSKNPGIWLAQIGVNAPGHFLKCENNV